MLGDGVSVCSRLTRLPPFLVLLCTRMRRVGVYSEAVLKPISENDLRLVGLVVMDLAGNQPHGSRGVAPHYSVAVGRILYPRQPCP